MFVVGICVVEGEFGGELVIVDEWVLVGYFVYCGFLVLYFLFFEDGFVFFVYLVWFGKVFDVDDFVFLVLLSFLEFVFRVEGDECMGEFGGVY